MLFGNGTWHPVPARAMLSTPQIMVLLPPSATVVAVRYAWDDVPATQLLYDSARGHKIFGLPAPPFWATCTATGCSLISPGQLPSPPPPPPSPPSPSPGPHPSAPPAPPSTACAFSNGTEIDGATQIAAGLVPFLDAAACCGMCKAFEGCAAAELMGSGHKEPPYPTAACKLFGTAGRHKAHSCPYPCGRMAIVPAGDY